MRLRSAPDWELRDLLYKAKDRRDQRAEDQIRDELGYREMEQQQERDRRVRNPSSGGVGRAPNSTGGAGVRLETERPLPPAARSITTFLRMREREHEAMLTEKQFQQQVIDLAKLRGWHVYHTHDSRRSEAGFPDLVLVRGGVLLYRELKTDTGRLSPAQSTWLNVIDSAGGDAETWRPRDWDHIESMLK